MFSTGRVALSDAAGQWRGLGGESLIVAGEIGDVVFDWKSGGRELECIVYEESSEVNCSHIDPAFADWRMVHAYVFAEGLFANGMLTIMSIDVYNSEGVIMYGEFLK